MDYNVGAGGETDGITVADTVLRLLGKPGSLKQFVREVTKEVASPKGGTVFDQWKADQAAANTNRRHQHPGNNRNENRRGES